MFNMCVLNETLEKKATPHCCVCRLLPVTTLYAVVTCDTALSRCICMEGWGVSADALNNQPERSVLFRRTPAPSVRREPPVALTCSSYLKVHVATERDMVVIPNSEGTKRLFARLNELN